MIVIYNTSEIVHLRREASSVTLDRQENRVSLVKKKKKKQPKVRCLRGMSRTTDEQIRSSSEYLYYTMTACMYTAVCSE